MLETLAQTGLASTVAQVTATGGLTVTRRVRRACLVQAQERSVVAFSDPSAAACESARMAWERVLLVSETEIDQLVAAVSAAVDARERTALLAELDEARSRVLLAEHATEIHSTAV